MSTWRRAAGTMLCVLAWAGAACIAYVAAIYLFGTILWMHVAAIPALLVAAALAAIPVLLCRACYRLGVRLRRSDVAGPPK